MNERRSIPIRLASSGLVALSALLVGSLSVEASPVRGSREAHLAALYARPLPVVTPAPRELARQDRSGWWNGAPDRSLLTRIRTRAIKRIKFNGGGSSLSLRLYLTDGTSAAFKPDQSNIQTVPRKEIAAYRINRLLGLSRVPPATWRKLTRAQIVAKLDPRHRGWLRKLDREAVFRKGKVVYGQVSHWIPKIRYIPIDRWKSRRRWQRWLKVGSALPAKYARVTAQISVMLLYDFLINNPDRFSGFNTMGTPDTRFLYFMDNTYSFWPSPDGGRTARRGLLGVQRFSRRLYRRLKALTLPGLRRAMKVSAAAPWPLLTEAELKAVIARRDYAIQQINRVIARFGWEKTMVFP